MTSARRRPLSDLVEIRLHRRQLLSGGVVAIGAALLGTPTLAGTLAGVGKSRGSSLTFSEVMRGNDEHHHVAPGYRADVLIRWGDPVVKDAPAFDPLNQTAAAQQRQFGYNNDFIGFMPLPLGSKSSDRGLLCVNHEYSIPHLMYPDLKPGMRKAMPKRLVDIEMAAHGHSVIEVKRHKGRWETVVASPFNRRFDALSTIFHMSGPAAGHDRLKTSADPSGREVIGTLTNCSGGMTPWGTILSGEENINKYFTGIPLRTPEAANHQRYQVGADYGFHWAHIYERFDVEEEPHEPNRFGWVVEIDPYDPHSTPIKRTALGRFFHEGATTWVNNDGRVTVYMGDDSPNEYLYRFVTRGKFDPRNRARNRDLLDDGVLSVAKFSEDGTLRWLPLVWGTAPLNILNGFESQADVLIEARRAADLLGATPMDRPEDVETNPHTGRVYASLTNNLKRKPAEIDAANPRPRNHDGHIIEMIPPGGSAKATDHTAEVYKWDIFILGGDPRVARDQAHYSSLPSDDGWISCPDNITFDPKGRIWIATDGLAARNIADGLFAADVEGPARGQTRRFFSCPIGAEMCGPIFTPDGTTLFLSVQHPADTVNSSYAEPDSRWPDFKPDMPPRPSVVAITKIGGGAIG